MMNQLVENEMQRVKKQALKTISSLVHSESHLVANMMGFAYFESQADAIKLADKLGLSKLDFLAINEDFEGFKEEYLSSDFCEVMEQYAS
jgi:hypothetical protein